MNVDRSLFDNPDVYGLSDNVLLSYIHLAAYAEYWRTDLLGRETLSFAVRRKRRHIKALVAAGLIVQVDHDAWRLVWTQGITPVYKREPISVSLRTEILNRDRCCVLCGSEDDLQIDHIVPVSKGGRSKKDNLQVLCGPCNQNKGAN
jgi:hypothetical protein